MFHVTATHALPRRPLAPPLPSPTHTPHSRTRQTLAFATPLRTPHPPSHHLLTHVIFSHMLHLSFPHTYTRHALTPLHTPRTYTRDALTRVTASDGSRNHPGPRATHVMRLLMANTATRDTISHTPYLHRRHTLSHATCLQAPFLCVTHAYIQHTLA